ncbi:MAG: exodeoxyribonuclease VII small subunit [Lachnospiraceae bacterium]|nr:exodeoxyribonuclease VII small subunit [Lachnospiraceae bacterium]MDE5780957.1 exodeoxyribonuclease VII small subunit [Lachnospiraceae bacterium]MDE6254152.1 exodeoxyribonuclease VII small subunit [Lachnospiraceae bacterium]
MAAESRSIEKSFEELEKIMEMMDSQEISLEESFKLYEKGMKLVKQCNDKIDKVEKKVNIIEGKEENEEF